MKKGFRVVLFLPIEPGDMRVSDLQRLHEETRAFVRVRLLEMGGKLLEPEETKRRKMR
jgi:hypothetical protein